MQSAILRLRPLIVVALLLLSTVAQADIKSDLQSRMNELVAMMKAKQFEQLIGFYYENYVMKQGNIRQTYADLETNNRLLQEIVKKVNQATAIVRSASLRQDGRAVAEVTVHAKLKVIDSYGVWGEVGKSHLLEMHSPSKMTFTRVNGKWLIAEEVVQRGGFLKVDGVVSKLPR